MKPTCSISLCTKKVQARGWCSTHYKRWHVHGDPHYTEVVRAASTEEALRIFTVREVGGCLVWQRSKTADGYSYYNGPEAKVYGTNSLSRILWIASNGVIPKGLEVDHKCFRRDCVDISHMRLLTRHQQMLAVSGKRSNGLGYRGVSMPRPGRYKAQATYRGVIHSAGTFGDLLEAAEAARAKREELYGDDYSG